MPSRLPFLSAASFKSRWATSQELHLACCPGPFGAVPGPHRVLWLPVRRSAGGAAPRDRAPRRPMISGRAAGNAWDGRAVGRGVIARRIVAGRRTRSEWLLMALEDRWWNPQRPGDRL